MPEPEQLSAASEYLRRCVSREELGGAGQRGQWPELSLVYYGKAGGNTLEVQSRGRAELGFSVGEYRRENVYLSESDVKDLVKELARWLKGG